jgi:enediyne biosynthesis protein E4
MTRKVLAFTFAFIAAAAIAAWVSSLLFKPRHQKGGPDVNAVERRQPIPVPPIKFTDMTAQSGITFRHTNGATGSKLLPETMGGGVVIFDYDGDGRPDILFVQSGRLPGDGSKDPPPTMALYRNLGGFKFQDVTREAGLDKPMYGMGVCVGDFDNDGRPDIFVSCIGKHHLFRNVDGKKFTDVTDAAGVGGGPDLPWGVSREQFLSWKDPIPFGSSCTFVDYDGDGKLDLFVCHYIEWAPKIDLGVNATLAGLGRAYVPPVDFNGAQCKLYRNFGNGKFQDVSKEAGIEVFRATGIGSGARQRAVGKCLGVIVCDPDEDGWPDLIVANDGTPNFYFQNRPDGSGGRKFVECGADLGVALPDDARARGGMGIDYGQILPNISAAIIANFANEPDTLLKLQPTAPPTQPNQARDLFFTDAALTYGLTGPSRTPLKFGAFFFDCDLDGRLDLLTCNGHIEPEIESVTGGNKYAQPAQLYWNTGREKPAFEPVTEATAGKDLFRPIVGRGSAFADLDGDGKLDVVLCANNGPPIVLRNDTDVKHHWLRLNLTGDGVHSNRSAIGATVLVEAGGRALTRMVVGGRGYLSQSELPVTIGLGDTDKVDRLVVKWPGKDLMEEVFPVPGVDRTLGLSQGEGQKMK